MQRTVSYANGRLEPDETDIVKEFALKLIVNQREIATLVCSPHDLTPLVAGFLRLQGFVETADDFLALSVCEEFGVANVRIAGEVPERLRPILTSGCGTGITFTLDARPTDPDRPSQQRVHLPAEIFGTMEQLARVAESYKAHGGIHSAAVGDGTSVLLYAEDLGRHNTLDRIAGAALLQGLDLSGTLLVTSGRVSTEMAAKAAKLGVSLVASRTSPTDMAVKVCEQAGIVLAGYVRGGRFTVYACPERVQAESDVAVAQHAPRVSPPARTS